MTGPFVETIECDLHELTVEAAMARFIDVYNRTLAQGRPARPIDVVHGFNRGNAILAALREFLTEHSDKLQFVAGELLDGNPGHTKVYPDKLLPAWQESLELRIAAFCSKPRPPDRIAGEFARAGEQSVKNAIERLVRSGSLQRITKNGRKCYVAIQAAD